MPSAAAARPTRLLASSAPIAARVVSFCWISVFTVAVALPIWAPSRSSATCIATIPSSATATMAIHVRPRTRRSSHGWSMSRRNGLAPRVRVLERHGDGRLGPETRRGAGGRRRGAGEAALRARAVPVAPPPPMGAALVPGVLIRPSRACARRAGARSRRAGWRRSRRRSGRSRGGVRARPRAGGRSRRPADRAGRCSRGCGPPGTA